MRSVKLLISKEYSPLREVPLNNITLINMNNAVVNIKDKTIGLTPFNAPLTYLLVMNLFIIIATMIIMIKEGSITPRVAHIAPNTPPTLLPMNVEIFNAKGPGVTSLTAIKSVNVDSVTQPLEMTCSSIIGIIA